MTLITLTGEYYIGERPECRHWYPLAMALFGREFDEDMIDLMEMAFANSQTAAWTLMN